MIQLVKDLIAIDSVNPSLVPDGAGEGEIAQRIAAELRSFGADVTVADAAPGRPNVVGVLDRGPGKTLMLCGHSDTVGVEGMTAPFDPVERDGKIFGRGSQDMKGGVAAILAAARALATKLKRGKVVVAVVADEEYGSVGAEALVRDWTADAAIVCEPTDLVAGIGHKGFEWAQITTHGVAAHGSRPDDGLDAIVMMGRVLGALERLEQSFTAGSRHPLLGRPSVHASLIEGGREMSSYPDRCTLKIERRTVDGEPRAILAREIEGMLAGINATSKFLFHRPPYLTPDGYAEMLGARERGAVSFWTDAAILGAAGIPSLIFGPGGAGLHSVEEYVRIAEMLECRDALVDAAIRFCS